VIGINQSVSKESGNFKKKYFILRSSLFENLLGGGCWFVSDVLEQGVASVLKGQTVQNFHRNFGDKTTKQRRSKFHKIEDVKLHRTEA